MVRRWVMAVVINPVRFTKKSKQIIIINIVFEGIIAKINKMFKGNRINPTKFL